MSGEEVARELINILSMEFCVKSPLLLAAMRDGASVNSVAMRTVSVVYPLVLDVRCFTHTLDIVGTKFNTPVLNTFTSLWISLFSHSPKTKHLWKEQTGKSMPSFSKTRWWSRWEVMQQIMTQFGDVVPFLDGNQDIGPSLRQKLLDILKDNQNLRLLKIELAATVDVCESFVKSTYNLEGDGPLVMKCYEEIIKLRSAIQVAHYPNVNAISLTLAGGSTLVQQQWIAYARNCVKDALLYFQSKFGDHSPLNAFKAARYFMPSKVYEMKPSASDIDSLSVIPFFDSATITSLK